MNSISPSTAAGRAEPEYDPVFVHSRREAIFIFFVWVAALLWAVPYCYFYGYVTTFDPENFRTVFGMPSWVFWGIAAPWLAADVITTWFCFFYMQEDNLGEAHEGEDLAEEVGEIHAERKEGAG